MRYLTIKDVCSRIGFSRSWVYNKLGLRQFPTPFHIGSSIRWLESDIEQWIQNTSENSHSYGRAK